MLNETKTVHLLKFNAIFLHKDSNTCGKSISETVKFTNMAGIFTNLSIDSSCIKHFYIYTSCRLGAKWDLIVVRVPKGLRWVEEHKLTTETQFLRKSNVG